MELTGKWSFCCMERNKNLKQMGGSKLWICSIWAYLKHGHFPSRAPCEAYSFSTRAFQTCSGTPSVQFSWQKTDLFLFLFFFYRAKFQFSLGELYFCEKELFFSFFFLIRKIIRKESPQPKLLWKKTAYIRYLSTTHSLDPEMMESSKTNFQFHWEQNASCEYCSSDFYDTVNNSIVTCH